MYFDILLPGFSASDRIFYAFCLKMMKNEYFFKSLEIMSKIDMKNSRLGTEACESGERIETTLFLEKVANFY